MAFYRKKPIVIEAFHWLQGIGSEPDPVWLVDALNSGAISIETLEAAHGRLRCTVMRIKTLEGTMTAGDGDYIVKGVNGELYPCKPDIFEKTYDKVDE